jgi:DNA-binding NtrC family response regulator
MRRIIIIEDDLEFAKALEQMLGILGYETVISADASFAFDLRHEDIVFLDVLMPGTSGFQVLDQLAHQGTKCPIVLISGALDRVESAERYAERLNLNLVGALEKPFRLADVRDVLDGI